MSTLELCTSCLEKCNFSTWLRYSINFFLFITILIRCRFGQKGCLSIYFNLRQGKNVHRAEVARKPGLVYGGDGHFVIADLLCGRGICCSWELHIVLVLSRVDREAVSVRMLQISHGTKKLCFYLKFTSYCLPSILFGKSGDPHP